MSQSNVEVPPVVPAVAPPAVPAPPATPVAAPTPVAVAPVAAVTPAPATPAAPVVSPPADEPSWFKPRIDQAKRSGKTEVLSALGVKDEAEAKALLDKARAVEEAAKTELQKAKEKADGFETRAKRADALEAAVKSQSDIELASLTEAQRAIVADIIGDDPATIVQKLPKLKASWATAAPAAAQAAAQVVAAPLAPAAPLPAPATTSPPPNAPGGSTVATPDHKAEYVALKAKNPHQAALYLNAYSDKIYPR